MKYFIQNGDERIGPFPVEELKSRGITKDTMVWCAGLYSWTKASEVLDLIDLFDPPEPGRKTIGELISDFSK